MTKQEDRFRRAFGGSSAEGFALQSGGGGGAEGDGAGRLHAAVAQLRLLLAAADEELGKARAEAVEELAALDALVEQFKRSASLPQGAANEVRLEAVIISDGSRPASLIKDGRLLAPEALGDFGEHYELDPLLFDAAFRATGRISNGRRISGGGTLLRVEIDGKPVEAVLTARHVAQELANDAAALTLSANAEIDFNGEIGAGMPSRHALAEVLACGPDVIAKDSPLDAWDFALIRLGDPLEGAARPAPATFALAAHLVAQKERAGIVSFPGRPPLRPSEELPGTIWHRLFQGLWSVKRFSPATLIAPPPDATDYHGLSQRVVLHDGTTTGGSSGGALLAIGSGQLAGVHVGGRAETANIALRLDKLAGEFGWSAAA